MKNGFFQKSLLAAFIIIVLIGVYQYNSQVTFSDEIEAALPEEIDFNYHIKPILSDRCFACHGPDANKREAGLRLDLEVDAFAALGEEKDHYAIVPGKPHKSGVYARITSTKQDLMMPPPESNLKLSKKEIALITRWIEQGAAYKPHWSFIKPEKPEIPQMDDRTWGRNEIDAFIQAKMLANDLKPSGEAGKEILIRRLSFDLTGLPPSVVEVDDFLQDTAPDAYAKLVDRLLDSPHYGERMASEWLDVARYADSHGYQDDGMRNMWPWRDWVIKTFNENLPYDDFLLWQLAGDMLPDATTEQKLATAFNRNHPQSQEGGIIDEEYRVEYVADRTNTLGKAILGLSTECARCHDHKYDPISQKEYFQLYAFFNSVKETGQIPYVGEATPTIILTDKEVEKQISYVQELAKQERKMLDPEQEVYQSGFKEWFSKVKVNKKYQVGIKGRIGYYPLDKPIDDKFINLANKPKPADMVVIQKDKDLRIVEGKMGNAVELVGDSYVDLGSEIGYFERNEPFTISLWFKALKDSIRGPIFSKTGGFANGFRGYELLLKEDGKFTALITHTWPANAIEVHALDKIPVGEWVHLVMSYDGSSMADGLKLYLNGETIPLDIKTDHLKRSILSYGKDKRSIGHPGNLQIGKRGTSFAETLDKAVVDEFSVFDRKLTAIEIAALYGDTDPLRVFLEAEKQAELLDYYLLNVNQRYQKHLKTLIALRGEENEILSAQPEVMVMEERREPRSTYILSRGAYDAPTEEVFPGTPSAVMEFPENMPKNRLGLAKWVIDDKNPLTARVAVNRYWQMIFGKGIVATSDDFGNQGEFPSHPELLDWLAVQFVESGWDVKAILKIMVTTATYRQNSELNEELLLKDPENVWLSRGPSYRMPAEMIRDNALAASELLVKDIGGPSVKPYQPKGLWKELATANVREYVQDTGANLYRRGLYTIWKRSSPPPTMVSFDASDKYVCIVERQKTNTPLQALVLMNDPQYFEASRILAEHMIKKGGGDLVNWIQYGFRSLTSRNPDPEELNVLQTLYKMELMDFQASPAAADSILNVGEHPSDPNISKEELAALTLVASTLMNYHEAVYKR